MSNISLSIMDEIVSNENLIAFYEKELSKGDWSDGYGSGGSSLSFEEEQETRKHLKEVKALNIHLRGRMI